MAIGKKDTEFGSKVTYSFKTAKMKSKIIVVDLKCKKMFLFEKIDENVQFSFLFLGISKIFISLFASA